MHCSGEPTHKYDHTFLPWNRNKQHEPVFTFHKQMKIDKAQIAKKLNLENKSK